MSSNDQTSTNEENDFSGIWNRDTKNQRITETAQGLAQNLPEMGATKKVKPWGLKSVFINFIVLIISQVGISLALIAIVAGNSDFTDANAVTNALTTSPWVILASSLSMYIVWVGGMLITTYRKGQKSLKKDFWVSFRWYDIFLGLGIAAFLYGAVFGLSWLAGDVLKLDMQGADNGSVFASLEGAWIFIIGFGIAAFLGPLSEELFFRGYVLQAFAKSITTNRDKMEAEVEEGFGLRFSRFLFKIRYGIAIFGSSVLFGLMHFQGVEHFGQWFVVIVTGTLGLVFAIVAVKLKRLGPGIFGHMFYNGGTLLLAFLLSAQ